MRWDAHLIEVNYFDDTQPEQQLARASEQHTRLKHALAQQCPKVSLHNILIGVMGTIYKCHTELPLNKPGLDQCRLTKLILDLNTHSIQNTKKNDKYKQQLFGCLCSFSFLFSLNIKDRTRGSF